MSHNKKEDKRIDQGKILFFNFFINQRFDFFIVEINFNNNIKYNYKGK